MTPQFTYSASVLRVEDGDSVVLDFDLGLEVHRYPVLIRLNGIQCEPKNTEAGTKATAFTTAWLAKRGGKVVVKTLKDKREQHGRYLGIFYDDAGKCLNDDLLAAGMARVWTVEAPK